ncbi:hypothetical protein CKM354_000672800 [Cercospora kikuchii]|uniref:Carboxylic ester hydrolase n=1 Tax=Cercospora kikuchii TaxID=84275 RepID=A0A9P3FDP2_9PEZI|nr:uncharacterized protein CKM354_000672800 [Cercospora kikuchii]GIZ43503.1 hypothetical protein CKM354_000672800 [Cercospora kikuchii]
MKSITSSILATALPAAAQGIGLVTDDFPVVDLGYARHAPTKINQTTLNNISYATYSNIRFAQPPVGDLRFRKPKVPPPYAEGLQDGVVLQNETNCIQSVPGYFTSLPGLNGTSWGQEDCLFLDVIVPEGVKEGSSVPVLHWIYGGGFFFGAKDTGGNPAALFDRMTADDKFVIVASNYRLGVLGWSAMEGVSGIDANAGLYDCQAALEWTRDNVHRFGGDSNQVTVMGQSAGGGIIEHLLAATSEGQRPSFQQAILSSPGYRPHVNRSIETLGLWRELLNQTKCTDFDCVQKLPQSAIAEANRYHYLEAPSGGFPGSSISYGPVIDGDLVKDLPDRVLQQISQSSPAPPSYVKRVIAGGMKNDGAASTIGDFTSWAEQVSVFARTPSNATISAIENLYGPFNGSGSSFREDGFVEMTPFDAFSGDMIFACHSHFAAEAFAANRASGHWPGLDSESYRYEMSVQPAVHGQDISYYFFDELVATLDPTIVESAATDLQQKFRYFVLGREMEGWPESTASGDDVRSWLNITADGLVAVEQADQGGRGRKCREIVSLFGKEADGW